ncbi:MAG: TolC family protein, partial [Thiovulaceae bacterium]|nr:TolC family protein [Sulfurimonadaceae bacterium]
KDISLQVTSLYFNMHIIKADVISLEQSKKQLEEQLHQQQKFFEAKLVTEDNVARIEAAIANTDYQIEVKKYAYDEYSSLLRTLTNMEIDALKQQSIIEPTQVEVKELDSIKSMQAKAESVGYKAEQLDSSNYPTVTLSDKYSYYKYGDDGLEKLGIPNVERIENQNVITLSLNMKLFDFGAASKQREVVLSEQNALFSQLAYKKKEVEEDIKLALRSIKKAKKLLYASELSQDASNRTYNIVHKKYKARVVDYVNYLDALSNKIEADAQYNRAFGALQISYAKYYYYIGLDIKEYIK